MSSQTIDVVERLVLAGVAITTRALAGEGDNELTFPQWRVLVILGAAANGATVSEVAAQIGVTLPATSRQLRRLQRRSLVEVERDTVDGRAMRARLTPEGRRTRDAIFDRRRAEIRRAVSRIPLDANAVVQIERLANALSGEP